jgi:hypothetical protein
MSTFSCVVLSCVGKDVATGRFPIQGALTKCLKRFMVSEVNCESDQARDSNP